MGRNRVQLRYQTILSPEQYGAQRAWEKASLERCPLHSTGTCSFTRHGTYLRKRPFFLKIARYYCPEGHTTFSLLPDFFAAKLPGTLDELEHVVITVEQTTSFEAAAEEVRPPETWESEDYDESSGVCDPITLEATKRWVKRRFVLVRAALLALAALMPELVGTETSLVGIRDRLKTESALLTLRQRANSHLSVLPPPLGFGQPSNRKYSCSADQQSMCTVRGP